MPPKNAAALSKTPLTSPVKPPPTSQDAAVPMSPVLHGLKFGCKRSMDDCVSLTPKEVGSLSKLRRHSSVEGYVLPFGRRKATLILDDGSRWTGYSFGSEVSVSGEVVFNTSMVGYPEALTDPSYRGQLLTLTYPLIGNYGVPAETKDDIGLPIYYESDNIHITGMGNLPSNHPCRRSLHLRPRPPRSPMASTHRLRVLGGLLPLESVEHAERVAQGAQCAPVRMGAVQLQGLGGRRMGGDAARRGGQGRGRQLHPFSSPMSTTCWHHVPMRRSPLSMGSTHASLQRGCANVARC